MRQTSILLLIAFLAVQILSLELGVLFTKQEISFVEAPADLMNSIVLFAYILLSAAAMFLLLKFYKGKKLFFAIEFFLIFSTINFVFASLVPEEIAFLIGMLAVFFRLIQPKLRAVFLLIASATVGAILGTSLDLLSKEFVLGPAILLAILLAVYDFIAVFRTKHMVKMAKELEKRNAAFAIEINIGKERVELGTGDLVIPAMLVSSATKISLISALLVMAGAFTGMLAIIILLEKKKGYYPALPPIIMYSLVGLAISFAIS